MTPDRWQEVERVYHSALSRDQSQRTAYLSEVCAGDDELRREVESLLAQSPANDFLAVPALDVAAREITVTDATVKSLVGGQLGCYSIQVRIGAGGMGEVYRARDTRLGRDVAIKILPRAFTADPERLVRFEREARVLAALNHPNIAAIHGLEHLGDAPALVLELVEGETLAEKLRHEPSRRLAIPEALAIARQIAEALEAAHEKGIVHRDLKPANIKITPPGLVKVLDFGLAKGGEPLARDSSHSPTLTIDGTQAGVLLGTAAYMSPQQARGQPVDKRADIWAFGCVLYEMLTGRLAFGGDTVSDHIAAILDREPDWTALPSATPDAIRRLMQRCLEKDARRRLHDIADARLEIDDALTTSRRLDKGSSLRRRLGALLTAAVLGLLVLAVVGLRLPNWFRARSTTVGGGRLTLLVSSAGEARDPALSPDGKMIAYIGGEGGQVDLYVSRVAGGERIRLTSDAGVKDEPSFSPDGERIAFSRVRPDGRTREICIVPALGGNVVPVVPDGRMPVWSPDGTHLAFVVRRPGEPDAAETAATDGSELRVVLKGDASYLYIYGLAWSRSGKEIAVDRSVGGVSEEIWMVPAAGGAARRLWQDPSGVISGGADFTPDGRGIVHYSNRGGATNLWVMPLNGGEATQLTFGAGRDVSPTVARNGAIAFRNERTRNALVVHQLTTGETRTLVTHHDALWGPSFSPDGREIAFSRIETDGSSHIFTVPADGGSLRQITRGRQPEIYARYTPDGSFILFHTWGVEPRRIFRVPREGGPAVPLTPPRSDHDEYADVSPDGRLLAFARTEDGQVHVYVAPVTGGQARRLTDTASTTPKWSPDGQWLAFGTDRTPRSGIWLIRADGTDQHRLTETGGWPVWWPDGTQLGYEVIDSDGNQQIAIVPALGGAPRILAGLRFTGTNHPFDVSRDGSRLVTNNYQRDGDQLWLLEPAGSAARER